MALPKIFKRSAFPLLVLTSFLFLFVPSVRAMVIDGGGGGGGGGFDGIGDGGHYQYDIWEPAVYQAPEMNQQSFTNETIRATVASMNDKILGCLNCPNQGQGAVQNLGNLIAEMYANPPTSSVEYFADLGRNLGIVKPVYAQGVGFEALSPILRIWKAFRNITYLFFVAVFIITGFAIMFRVKIDPQAAISIQNALPRIVTALILVTFSYAIAGLIIDLMYIFIFLIISVFQSQGLISDVGLLKGEVINQNVFALFKMFFMDYVGGAAGAINDLIQDLINVRYVGSLVGALGGGLAGLIFAIALLFSVFRLFLILLTSYLTVIISTILAPFMLLFNTLPGQRGFTTWIRTLFANIIVFPVTVALFILTAILVGSSNVGVTPAQYPPGGGWVPPLIGLDLTTERVQTLIGLGMILLIPQIVDKTKKAVGAPDIAGRDRDTGIGAALGFGAAVPLAGARGLIGGYRARQAAKTEEGLIGEGGFEAWQKEILKRTRQRR